MYWLAPAKPHSQAWINGLAAAYGPHVCRGPGLAGLFFIILNILQREPNKDTNWPIIYIYIFFKAGDWIDVTWVTSVQSAATGKI